MGCNTCPNALIIRGNPLRRGPDKDWKTGYWFQYSMDGYFSVWVGVDGYYSPLKNWTRSTAIFTRSHLNTLKVVAAGSALKFYINDILVWAGRDYSLSTGRVGVDMYRSNVNTGNILYVDWAHMTVPGAALPFGNESVAPGSETPGGNRHQSP